MVALAVMPSGLSARIMNMNFRLFATVVGGIGVANISDTSLPSLDKSNHCELSVINMNKLRNTIIIIKNTHSFCYSILNPSLINTHECNFNNYNVTPPRSNTT